MVAQKRPKHQHKRHGSHQKRTHRFLRVYHPYLPFACISLLCLIITAQWQPHNNKNSVLAYATSISASGLLQSTNQQRSANSKASLSLNSKLSQAAQAKANDMATRNYWSHNTPEGNEPWIFITQAGYNYTRAGENLAYGFTTSEDTIIGWMNSSSHKDNLLNSYYSEVGFGYANNENFQNSGPQTVVVAMYGTPQVAGATTTSPTTTPSTPSKTNTSTQTQKQVGTAQPTTPPAPADIQTPPTQEDQQTDTSNTYIASTPKKISRLETITKGAVPWIATAVSVFGFAALALLISKHSVALHRTLIRGEKYILHNLALDVTIISLLGLCFVLTRTAGVIY